VPLVEQFLEGWSSHLRILRGLSQGTADNYCTKVQEFVYWLEHVGRPSRDPRQIDRRDIEDYLAHLYYDRGNSNTTRRVKLIALNLFWRYLVYEREVDVDITAEIPKPKIQTAPIARFTQSEVYRFFKSIDPSSEVGVRDAGILVMLAMGGLRAGEVVRLNVGDLSEDMYEHMEAGISYTKHGRHRMVSFWKAPSLILREVIAHRLGHGANARAPLFISYSRGGRPIGNRLASNDIDRLVKRIAERAGIRKPRVHPHMFRSSHAADLRQVRGFDVGAIAARLGHKNIATTDRYLPTRERITKEYPSLASYWADLSAILAQGATHDANGEPHSV